MALIDVTVFDAQVVLRFNAIFDPDLDRPLERVRWINTASCRFIQVDADQLQVVLTYSDDHAIQLTCPDQDRFSALLAEIG